MKIALLITLLTGLMVASGATALALVSGTSAAAQGSLPVVNGLAIVDSNPTCGRTFTAHVNVANQTGSTAAAGTVTLQNIHRGTGSVNYTGYGNYPAMEPGGNYVVPFQVTVNQYVSEGQELIASTYGGQFSLKYDIDRGDCSKTSSSDVDSGSGSVPPGSNQAFQVRHSGKCLDIPGGSPDQVTPVQQFTCTGANNQQWVAQAVGNGYYRIVSRFSGMCLDVQGFSQQPQALVQQYPCNGGDNQSFSFQHVSGDYSQIVAKHSNMCLDVRGASVQDQAAIQQYPCTGNTNQQWRYQ